MFYKSPEKIFAWESFISKVTGCSLFQAFANEFRLDYEYLQICL